MSCQAFESDVPPLKVRCGPISGSANSSRSVQHTQKSFSILTAGRRVRVAASMHAARRSSAESPRKASIRYPFPGAS